MIKRLLIIAFVTGLGHLTTLFSLKYITKLAPNNVIAIIGEIDTLSLLIVAIIAFGLQLSTTREVSLTENWKQELEEAQSARLTLSLMLMLLAITGYFYSKNYLFLISPIIALNADYALYGRGKAVMGSFVSLLRVIIPALTLIICSIYFINNIVLIFALSIFVAYLIAGIVVSKSLNIPFFVKPKFQNLKKYLSSLNIGIASISFFFVGIGILNALSYFYDEETVAVGYIALKIYMIFKGVKRIIVQSFFRELKEKNASLRVDFFSIVAGMIFLFSLLFFPKTVITLLSDSKYLDYTLTFLILGIAGFVSSFTSSTGTLLLLNRQDKQYSAILVAAALVSILSGLAFWFLIGSEPYLIATSVLLGEITISIFNVVALKENKFISSRMKLSLPLLLLAIAFAGFSYFLGQELLSLFLSLLIFGLGTLVFFKIKFN